MEKNKKMGTIIIIIIACLILVVALSFLAKVLLQTFGEKSESGFLASTEHKVQLYELVEEEYKKVKSENRGTKISIYEKEYSDGAIKYTKIKLKGKNYYVKKGLTTTEKEKSVKEKTVYVRTPTTLYYNLDSSSIVRSIQKGDTLEVLGYDHLQKDGSVNMYKVKVHEKEGYVYAKYVVQNKEQSLKPYNENGIYDLHKTRENIYGGGSADNLDYYPVKKASFKKNKMPKEVRALYINTSAIGRIDDYIALAKKNNINAFVIDIKGDIPAYQSKIIGEYSKSSYKKAPHTFEDYKTYVQRAIEEGFYVIGRISTFKDYDYAIDHPEEAILDTRTGNPFLHGSAYWPSPYSRNVWEYNVELAKEAVKEIGFHEIQFDYIRFPDQMNEYEKNGTVNLRNTYGEEKAAAIQQFLMYASDEIHKLGAYVSADVFGVSAGAFVTSYGQYWPSISNVVDVISAMPYPDHFAKNAYGLPEPVWKDPYSLLTKWGSDAVARQNETPSKAIVRTWIEAYDTTKEPYISYDTNKISEQIRALYASKLQGGYMAWNVNSSLEKYTSIASAFKKEYINE